MDMEPSLQAAQYRLARGIKVTGSIIQFGTMSELKGNYCRALNFDSIQGSIGTAKAKTDMTDSSHLLALNDFDFMIAVSN